MFRDVMFCICSKFVVLLGTLQVRCLLQLSRFQVHNDMSVNFNVWRDGNELQVGRWSHPFSRFFSSILVAHENMKQI